MRVELASIAPAREFFPKPSWLKIRPPTQAFTELKQTISRHSLHTVCQEAHCPNMSECWSKGTATFMVLGEVCTRGCRFCAVKSGNPMGALDHEEPIRLAKCVREMNLRYVVVTSVDRDDLPDQGASHFAECVRQVKRLCPGIIVEVLTPDFRGNKECIKTVTEAGPNVFDHNVETVKRLQSKVRDRRANYEQSLSVLQEAKSICPSIYTKSSIMLGLGEKEEEVIEAMSDLREVGVDILTLGQYLRPGEWHLPVEEWVTPEKFEKLKKIGEELGFLYVASGPFVRSSYRAGELFVKSIINKKSSSS